jgi:hypothetical protein
MLNQLKDIIVGIKGESTCNLETGQPENAKFVEAMTAKWDGAAHMPEHQNAYTLTKAILAGLEKTGGDDTLATLFAAITSMEIKTPAGLLKWDPSGVAICPMYVTTAEKVGEELAAPLVRCRKSRSAAASSPTDTALSGRPGVRPAPPNGRWKPAEVLHPVANFIQNLFNGVTIGMVYFLIAAGMSIVLGVMGITNLAHGSIFMIGAYSGWTIAVQLELNYYLALIVGGLAVV